MLHSTSQNTIAVRWLSTGDKLCYTGTGLRPCTLFNMEESSDLGEPCLGEKEANFLLD